MEWLNELATSSGCHAARKKRSTFHRRPHPNPKPVIDDQNVHRFQSSRIDYEANGGIKSCYPNNHSTSPGFENYGRPSTSRVRSDENRHDRSKEPLLESDHLGNEHKLKKVKLKLGGVTRTLHTKSASGNGPVSDVSRNRASHAKESSSRVICRDYAAVNGNDKYDSVYKTKRVTKKRAVDDISDEDDEEIRYLKKLRASKAASGFGERQEESGKKTKGIAKLKGLGHSETGNYGSPGLGKEGKKKLRRHKVADYEMELTSDDELGSKKIRPTEDFMEPLMGSGQEMTVTTRKRALECPESGGLVEFPNGLPDASSKKQKLSEVEQQLRKAEAAQRRRLQAEKAAKEAEAEAIRKILGQDSNRKKKEEKLKKQQQELAQEKTDKAATLGLNTVRWIMGPQGTIVTFSDDIGLPKIFDSRPNRYPPPREKCAGPNCTNEYKYRDSKSKLPLCSLHCYKAVQGNIELQPAC